MSKLNLNEITSNLKIKPRMRMYTLLWVFWYLYCWVWLCYILILKLKYCIQAWKVKILCVLVGIYVKSQRNRFKRKVKHQNENVRFILNILIPILLDLVVPPSGTLHSESNNYLERVFVTFSKSNIANLVRKNCTYYYYCSYSHFPRLSLEYCTAGNFTEENLAKVSAI